MDGFEMNEEPTMAEVMRSVALMQSGEREEARSKLLGLWQRLGPNGAPSLRSSVAHFLADTEDEPELELGWDRLALEAATGVTDGTCNPALTQELEAFLPSLHLNVGDAYRRVGNLEMAKLHAETGIKCSHVIADEGYGATVKEALRRLRERVGA